MNPRLFYIDAYGLGLWLEIKKSGMILYSLLRTEGEDDITCVLLEDCAGFTVIE